MYHIKNNKLIILEPYLAFKYDFKLDEVVIYSSEKHNFTLQRKLSLIGSYIYNNKELSEKIRYNLYQDSTDMDFEEFIDRYKNVDKNIELNKKKFEDFQKDFKDLEGLQKLIEGLNKYKSEHEDFGTKFMFLDLDIVKYKLNTILNDIEKKGYINE